MQLDPERKALYEEKAPELLDAVTSGEAELIMKRDPETDYCVKFDQGWCGIHKEHGDNFLGDACHFYPRITRQFGEETLMAATLSCPEITHSILYSSNPFALAECDVERLPYSLKNYLPEGVSAENTISIIHALITMAGEETSTPEHTIAKLIAIASSLQHTKIESWADGINMLISMAEGRLLPAEISHMDPFHLMSTLAALIYASKKTARPRLDETFTTMEKALGITIDRTTLDILQDIDKPNAFKERQEIWNRPEIQKEMAPLLRRWIQAQIAMASFPFAGFGDTVMERAIILAVRFATIRLALMCHISPDGTIPDEQTCVRVIQSLSRFMDHLAEPELSIRMYEEAGWTRETRLRAVVGDY